MASAGRITLPSRDGVQSSPSRKNTISCIKLVTPSKNNTWFFLLGILAFPRMMPAI